MSIITVDPASQWRSGCTHWTKLSSHLQEWLASKQLPENVVLHFRTEDKAFPSDGSLHFVFGQKRWEIPSAIEESEGHLLGQALVGRMYVRISGLPDCPDDATTIESNAIKKLLDSLLPKMVESDPEKRAAMIAEAKLAERGRSREAYVKECSKRFEKTVQGTKKAISDGHAAVARLQEELVRKIRETQGAERKLEQLEASRGNQLEAYGLECDKLFKVPKVKRVEAKEGKVVIHTNVLYCVDPRSGLRHEIGAFRIELDATRGCPRWFNLTRQVDGYRSGQMAPHIWESGEACLGNTAEIFPDLIGNYEFAAAAMVAIQFVESVNTDDPAGKKIDKWPVVLAEEKVNAV